jgi:Pectate lyase superfamily protein
MRSDVTKRALSAGLGVGALALLARRASADTPFSSFAFPATGAPTARTLPDRLAELKNVKDFGARGNGTTDDTAAIQAAFNAALTSGGQVYFPPGTYHVTRPITATAATHPNGIYLDIFGSAGIIATFPGYIFDFAGDDGEAVSIHVTGLSFSNNLVQGGGIQISRGHNHSIRDCSFACGHPINFASTFVADVVNCFLRPGVSTDGVHGSVIGTIGIMVGAGAIQGGVNHSTNIRIRCCDFNAFEHGIRVHGGASIHDCRIEMCGVGIVVGMTQQGAPYNSGALIERVDMEANGVHIWTPAGGYGVVITHCSLQADAGFSAADDGKDSPVGLWVGEDTWLTTNLVGVQGHYRDAAIKFDGRVFKSIMMSTYVFWADDGTALPGSVPWRNVPTSNITFIQCNNP